MWEYVARGGTQSVRWTEASLAQAANLGGGLPDGYPVITTVGRFPPKPFGFHDMLGNVSEWSLNLAYSYGTSAGSDPETKTLHKFRGGNARDGPPVARSAQRRVAIAEAKDGSPGLRPARTVESH